jgi:hypothetical protein
LSSGLKMLDRGKREYRTIRSIAALMEHAK